MVGRRADAGAGQGGGGGRGTSGTVGESPIVELDDNLRILRHVLQRRFEED